MSYFSKNKLITFILISMILGLVLGYAINVSLTKSKFSYDRAAVESIKDPTVKKAVESELHSYEEAKFKESKEKCRF